MSIEEDINYFIIEDEPNILLHGSGITKKSQDRDVAAIDIYLKYSKIKDTTIVSCVGGVIYTLLQYIHNSYWIISKTLHSIKQQVSMFVMRRLFPHHPVG